MAFNVPPLLDDFNRTEDPLSTTAGWNNIRVTATAGGRILQANGTQALAEAASGFCSQCRAATETLGPDTSVAVTIPTMSADGTELIGLFLRLQQEGAATADSYGYFISKTSGASNDVWQLDRIIDNYGTGSASALSGTTAAEFNAGDTLGVQCQGTGGTVTCEFYQCLSGNDETNSANYSLIKTVSDTGATRITTAGRVAVELNTNAARLENFRAGTIVAPGVVIPTSLVVNQVAVFGGVGRGWW